jgi:predicted DNA-binding transcriptional regulator AlpA
MRKTNINNNNISKLAQGKNMPTLLSVHELAAYLHKSTRWIHLERSAGRLPPSVMVGRSRFWIADDVGKWLKLKKEGR